MGGKGLSSGFISPVTSLAVHGLLGGRPVRIAVNGGKLYPLLPGRANAPLFMQI